MGLFNKFSKKNAEKEVKDEVKTEEVNEAEEETAQEPKAEENKVIDIKSKEKKESKDDDNEHKTTRFTLLIDCIKELDNGQGVIVGGNLHGTMNVNDKIFILHPMFKESRVISVDGIQLLEGENVGEGESVEYAKDQRVGLKIMAVKEKARAPKYSVVTNIIPQLAPHPTKPLDNPFLLGLTYEYHRLINDRMFADLFTFTVFSTGYLTPVELEQKPVPGKDGAMKIMPNSKVGFKLLTNPDDQEEKMLAVFTDFAALGRWKSLFEGGNLPNSIMLSFDKVAEIALANSGYIINPFGPAPVLVAKQNIEYAQHMKSEMDKKIAEKK